MSRTDKSKKSLYLDQLFDPEDEVLLKICQATQKEGVERMQISRHEAKILQFLVQISKAKKVVEVGTLYGYSTLHIARALPEGGQVFTLDISLERQKQAQKILKNLLQADKIRWLNGPALNSLKNIEPEGPFDMIFIDADKIAYLDYLDWAKKHLKKGGLLTADNTFLFGAVYGESNRLPQAKTVKIMKEFNRRLARDPFWKGALLPTSEGLTVAIKQ